MRSLFQNSSFNLATWNVHGGLGDNYEIDKFFGDMRRYRVDVACLQETHQPLGCEIERDGGKISHQKSLLIRSMASVSFLARILRRSIRIM